MLEQNDSLFPFIVLYTSPDFNVPEASLFYAEDSSHAEEQFEEEFMAVIDLYMKYFEIFGFHGANVGRYLLGRTKSIRHEFPGEGIAFHFFGRELRGCNFLLFFLRVRHIF